MLTMTLMKGEKAVIETPEGRRIEVVMSSVRTWKSARIGFITDPDVDVNRQSVHEDKKAKGQLQSQQRKAESMTTAREAMAPTAPTAPTVTMNCGECLVNKVKLVTLVDRVCPECKADYRDVTEFKVVAVVPDPARTAAPKAA